MIRCRGNRLLLSLFTWSAVNDYSTHPSSQHHLMPRLVPPAGQCDSRTASPDQFSAGPFLMIAATIMTLALGLIALMARVTSNLPNTRGHRDPLQTHADIVRGDSR